MARKPVLEGGKRDELIAAALELFLAKGYEGVSVRMILDEVGGEVGMFYHYFKSKNEIFTTAVQLYLKKYTNDFAETLRSFENSTDIFEDILGLLKANLAGYGALKHDGFHWSTQLALNEMTVIEIVPSVATLLGNLRAAKKISPPESFTNRELAAYILFGARAILHETPLFELTENALEDKWHKIKEMTMILLCQGKKEVEE